MLTLNLDLKQVGAIPYLSQWCGPWAMLPDQMQMLCEVISRMDIGAHLANVQAKDQTANDDGYGYYTQLVDGIAHVSISGTLMKQASSLSNNTSTVVARREIRQAANDTNVRGIMLSIDSPGGTVAGTRELANEVAAAAMKKPTHAFVEDMCASAAYWITSQASRISGNATSLIGSIGTFAVIQDLSQMAAGAGVKVHVVKAGEMKGTGTPGTEVTAAQLGEMQRVIDDLNSFFLAGIEQGRKLSGPSVKSLNDGRVHVANRAQDLQMIDAVNTFDEACAELQSVIEANSKKRKSSMTTTAPAAEVTTEAPVATAPVVPAAIDSRAELKKYMAEFGAEAGAKFFADGLGFTGAQSCYITTLKEQVAAANSAKAEAENKLASLNTGEKTAIDTGAPAVGEKQAATGWNSLFKQKA